MKLNISKTNLRSIQQVPISQMMAAYHAASAEVADAGGGGFAPTMDGAVIPYHPFFPEASPVNPEVPVIVGANRTEMTYFADAAAFSIDEKGMRSRIVGVVGEDNADAVIEVYRHANPDASAAEIYFLVYSDARYVMPSITIAERRAALNAGSTYLYYLTWETAETGRGAMSPHTLDIPFVFDNVRDHPLTSGRDDAVVLADKISDTIIKFAGDGDPNMGKLPNWASYNAASRSTLVWNNESKLINDPIAEQRKVMQPILNL